MTVEVEDDAATLHRLLARARAAGVPTGALKASSGLGRSALPHCTIANAVGARIYPAPHGGWHGDVRFDVPIGVPDVLGSPVERPHATREAAEDQVVRMLAWLIDAPPAPPAPPVFLLYGWQIELGADVLAEIAAKMAAGGMGMPSAAEAEAHLAALTADLPRGFDFGALPLAFRTTLVVHAHMAALCGVSVFPPRQPGPPVQ